MSQQPKTETDRLANVIQVLQLGHKTGRLVVERNEGSAFEQGLITFVNGQIAHASVNQQQGPNALSWLKSWGHCRFAFSPEQSNGMSHMPTLSSQIPTQGHPTNGSGPITSTSLPTHSLPSRSELLSKITTGKLGEQSPPTPWLTTPYRTRQIEEGMRFIEHMGLSRTHRRLFLLIDGRRTIRELTRLMTHEPEEVLKLLQDLERSGVIQM